MAPECDTKQAQRVSAPMASVDGRVAPLTRPDLDH